MDAVGKAIYGVFLILGGALLAINHPVIDWLNRWLKASGTSQRPSDIEMDETSELVGFVVGAFAVLLGLILVVQAVA